MITVIDTGEDPIHRRFQVRLDNKVYDYYSNDVLIQPIPGKSPAEYSLAVNISDVNLSRRVASHRFTDVPELINVLTLMTKYRSLISDWLFHDVVISRQEREPFRFEWGIGIYLTSWKERFSVADYVEEFIKTLESSNKPLNRQESVGLEFSIVFEVRDPSLIIEAEFLKHVGEVKVWHDQTIASLTSKLDTGSVSMFFDFPEAVKIPCEQYLLYFAQFLKDLGVEANTALSHEAGQVLFRVTPSDETEALEKIRTALDVYLHLPSSPVTDAQNQSIATPEVGVKHP